jgi:hypothetical protein
VSILEGGRKGYREVSKNGVNLQDSDDETHLLVLSSFSGGRQKGPQGWAKSNVPTWHCGRARKRPGRVNAQHGTEGQVLGSWSRHKNCKWEHPVPHMSVPLCSIPTSGPKVGENDHQGLLDTLEEQERMACPP